MSGVFFIALRRLRAPLILIVLIYAISIVGLTLAPGVDAQGQSTHLTIFQAFYFVSYTATTIGFGEIPYAFSDVQRLWVSVIIYASVVGWTFLIGNLIALSQDKGFGLALRTARFRRTVRRISEPFHLICGMGETGLTIVRSLDRLDLQSVVLDVDDARIQELELEDLSSDPPALTADARAPDVLTMAGVMKPECQGVLVLSNDDRVNLAIAVAVRLLNPTQKVICRCHTPDIATSLHTLGVSQIINPFQEFADRLVMAMIGPNTYRLLSWLTGLPGTHLPPRVPAPPGRWVVCGYGRFGAEVVTSIRRGGFDVSIIDPRGHEAPDAHMVQGLGTDAAVLRKAGVEDAAGVVAGTDDDAANLLIAIAARQINPQLFVILRQNLLVNRPLFEAAGAAMTMVSSEIVANECLALLRTPLLGEFLDVVKARGDDWAEGVVRRLMAAVGEEVPHFWAVTITMRDTPGLVDVMRRSPAPVVVADLYRDIVDRDHRANCLILHHVRDGIATELPADDFALQEGDTLLVAGDRARERDLRNIARNLNVASDVILGDRALSGWVWRTLRLQR